MSAIPLEVPREPFLVDIFHHWQQSPERILIREQSAIKKESRIDKFLYDVLKVRQHIYERLAEDAKFRLVHTDSDVFIAILAMAGYEFAVVLFAIYSIGAVAVPLSPGVLLEEAKYFLKICDAVLLISNSSESQLGQTLSDECGIGFFTFNSALSHSPPQPAFVLGPENSTLSPDKGLALLYTSGTSSLPKGVLHSRYGTHVGIKSQVETFGLSNRDTWLHHSPVHWGAGFTILIACLISGACVEFCGPVFDLEWLARRLESRDATCLYLPPSQLDTFAHRLSARLDTWSQSRYEAVLSGLKKLRVLCSGAVPIPLSTQAAWKGFRDGRSLVVVYAMTESMGLVASTSWKSEATFPSGCCGTRTPIVEVKVDDAGEICIKGPSLFKRYLSNDPSIMTGVFDSQGFYKTGDLGKLEGNLVSVFGRAAHDVIRIYAWRLCTVELEEVLSKHPLVAQAIVLGIPHPTMGQQVAVLLVTGQEMTQSGDGSIRLNHNFSLLELRMWLAIDQGLPKFKLPTLLRVVGLTHRLPVTASGKIVKPKIRELFFNDEDIASGQVECCDLLAGIAGLPERPFDWSGIQASQLGPFGQSPTVAAE